MPVKTELEPRYAIIKLKKLDDAQRIRLDKLLRQIGGSVEAVVIEADWPGYEQAKNIAVHGRTCKLGETVEARDACFDWVKV